MSYEPENPTSDLPQDAQSWLFRQFQLIQQELVRKTTAGFAGLYLSQTTAVTESITPTPTKITGFDQKINTELEAIAWISNSTIRFRDIGAWRVSAQIAFLVTADASNTREVRLQLFNETTSKAVVDFAPGSIPAGGSSMTLGGSVLSEIGIDNINNEIALYIYSPSGHTIAVTSLELLDFSVNRVSVEV